MLNYFVKTNTENIFQFSFKSKAMKLRLNFSDHMKIGFLIFK